MHVKLLKIELYLIIIIIFLSLSLFPNIGGNILNSSLEDKVYLNIDPVSEWSKTYGGQYSENCYCFQQTSDGGYILLGITMHNFETYWDFWLIKIDSQGNVEWDNFFHRDRYDYGSFVRESDDGGFILVGSSQPSNGNRCLWLIKTDSKGDMEWNKTFPGRGFTQGNSISKTTDGGYIITGYNSYGNFGFKYDTWLIKTDSQGNMEWNKTYERICWDEGNCVQQTSDGGYIIVGGIIPSFEASYSDPFIIKTNSEGELEWNRLLGDHSNWNAGRFIQFTSDGGYIIASDFSLIKTDGYGNEQWTQPIGGMCVRQTNDGGFIVTGTKEIWEAMDGFDDLLLVKTDAQGDTEWEQTFGAVGNDRGMFVFQTLDEGFIVVGSTEFFGIGASDIWLIKIGEKPTLKISDIKGGRGISAVIKNTGTYDITDIEWSINLDGRLFPFESVFIGKEKSGTISSLSSGAEISIVSSPVFGFGPAIIRVRAGIVIETVNCFLFGSKVKIISSVVVHKINLGCHLKKLYFY